MTGRGSRLAADNQALRSFAALAILGELALATAAAALTVLPAALLALDRRRSAG